MIQMLVPAWDLHSALDDSVDAPCGVDEEYLWEDKLYDSLHYRKDLADEILAGGQKAPICVLIDYDGKWIMGNGHHRMALAIAAELDIIVLFNDEDDDYMVEHITDPDDYYPMADGFLS